MKKYLFLLSTLMLFTMGSLTAQDRAPSPATTVSQKVGLTDVTIEYSRPSMKDRTIFAKDGLVPFGKIWRTGANAATKITFSGPVTIGGTELEAGSYAILTKPDKNKWAVHFYPYKESRWTTYRDAKPAAMAEATPTTGSSSVESFLITIDNLRDYSAHLVMMWDEIKVEFSFTVK